MGVLQALQAIAALLQEIGPLIQKLKSAEQSPAVQEVIQDLELAFGRLHTFIHGGLQAETQQGQPAQSPSGPSAFL